MDVFDETGRFHSIERYTRSGTLQSMMAGLVNEVAAEKGRSSCGLGVGVVLDTEGSIIESVELPSATPLSEQP